MVVQIYLQFPNAIVYGSDTIKSEKQLHQRLELVHDGRNLHSTRWQYAVSDILCVNAMSVNNDSDTSTDSTRWQYAVSNILCVNAMSVNNDSDTSTDCTIHSAPI